MNTYDQTVKDLIEPMEEIFERMRSIISHSSGGNAREFARKCDIPYGTLQGYFRKRLPHAEHLIRMANCVGVNINWLLTGRGEMFGVDSVAPEDKADLAIDLEVLHRIIKWVEEKLESEGKELTSDKKARFIALAYEYFASPEEGKDVDDKGMNQLFKLVV